MTKPFKQKSIKPVEQVEYVCSKIARSAAADKPALLDTASTALETELPLPYKIECVQFLAHFTDRGSPAEKRLLSIWEKSNIAYAARSEGSKRATRTDMNKHIREPNNRFAEPAARVYCIVTYGHPRDLWVKLKMRVARKAASFARKLGQQETRPFPAPGSDGPPQ